MHKSNLTLLIILSLGILKSMFAGPALSNESATPSNSFSPLTIVDSNSGKLDFSKAEQDWLAQNHVVHVRVGNYAPIQVFNKKPSGIAIDYLNAIAEKTGIQIEYRKEIHWADSLNKIRDHKGVDLLLGAMSTAERRKYLTFTDVYFSFPSVIFTCKDSAFVSSLKDLSDKIIAVQNKVVVHDLLVEKYPDLKLLLKDTEEDALRSLVTGESDAYVGNLTVGSFYIRSNGWNNAKVAAPTGFDPQNLSMAVRSDWPELAQIINKTMTAFTPVEHTTLRSKWAAPIRYEYGIHVLDIVKWVVGISSILFVIIAIILRWNKKLAREIVARTIAEGKLTKSEEKYRGLYNNNPLPYQSLDGNGYILDVNPIWLTFLGYQREEVIGKHYTKFLHPESQQDFDENFPKLKQRGRVNAGQFQLTHKDGQFLYISLNGSVGYKDDGNVNRTYCVFYDITERKQAEKEREQLINELQEALVNVKTLSGLLPICANCKKIRDDKGYWNQIEEYIQRHSEAIFSHGICSECSDELYGKEDWYIEMKKKEKQRE